MKAILVSKEYWDIVFVTVILIEKQIKLDNEEQKSIKNEAGRRG